MSNPVHIVTLDRGFSINRWLCDPHIEDAKRQGWDVKAKRALPVEQHCEDCRENQRQTNQDAPGATFSPGVDR